MGKLKFKKDREGVAFIWMIMAFSLLTIFTMSIIHISRQDILESKMQGERLQTYYIALAGAELTYAALMDEGNGLEEIPLKKIIEKLKINPVPMKDNIDINYGEENKGTAEVTIERISKNKEKWIKITSIGKLKNKDTRVSTIIRINETNNQIIREKFDQ